MVETIASWLARNQLRAGECKVEGTIGESEAATLMARKEPLCEPQMVLNICHLQLLEKKSIILTVMLNVGVRSLGAQNMGRSAPSLSRQLAYL